MTNIEEKELGVKEIWEIVVRRRWWILVPAFAIWAGVFTFSWFVPSQYRSETVILVEQQKVPQQFVVSNVASDMQERLQSMTQQILSRTRLMKIIQDFKLYQNYRNRKSPDELVDLMRDEIKIDLVRAPGDKDLTAFKIYYSSSSPVLAQQVTNELTTLFIDENLRAREQQSQGTTDFLQRQVEAARTNLEQQESKLRDFKLQYLGQLPAQLQPNVQILTGLQNQLAATQSARDQAIQQNTYLTSLLSQYKGSSTKNDKGSDGTGSAGAVSTDQKLEALRVQLAELKSKYTDEHPDVVKLQQQIAETERLRDNMASNPSKYGTPGDATITPMAQISSQLKANQLQIQSTDKQIASLQQKIGEYQSRLNVTPLREQQMSDLTRDYEQSKTNYDSLLSKQMQSSLATNLEKRQQGEQFRIIDPPSLPIKPVSPNRLIWSLGGLALGLALGAGLVAVMEAVNDVVRNEHELLASQRLPILAEIPHMQTAVEVARKRWYPLMEAAAMVAMLVVVTGSTVMVYFRG
jgi:polysaccharide chain length determinant protein (PEP-CTERM system associated)